MEAEEMINKVRDQQGRPFDMKQLTFSCVANVIMNMMFGHRFDHSDPAFQMLISDVEKFFKYFSFATEIFPSLRFLPGFKKNFAEYVTAVRNIFNFINSNIATCREVCSFFNRAQLRMYILYIISFCSITRYVVANVVDCAKIKINIHVY